MPRKKTDKSKGLGKINIADRINAKLGKKVSFNLKEENPTEVTQWIPTGSRWLDSIICKGKYAGIPVGKVTEIAGLSATGKSYMACQISAEAQKMGFPVVYFDSEMSMDPSFLERSGVNLDTFHYTQATTIEDVLETIEDLMSSSSESMLFILDSYPLTPTRAGKQAEEIDSRRDIAEKPRILAEAFARMMIPLANHQSTVIILNQLKTKIPGRSMAERVDAMINPYYAPGGKTMDYPLSLRIWLTRRKAKKAFVFDENGYKIGNEVKVHLEKSRFGTEGRVCSFCILWGVDEPGIQNEESMLEALENSNYLTVGSWCMLYDDDGVQIGKSFRRDNVKDFLKDTEGARERFYELMDREVIQKFDKREGPSDEFYKLNDDEHPIVDLEEETNEI